MLRDIRFAWYVGIYNFGLFVKGYFHDRTGNSICDWAFLRVGKIYNEGRDTKEFINELENTAQRIDKKLN